MEKVIAKGCCMECPNDTYTIRVEGDILAIETYDGDYDEGASAYIPKEEAIELANKILNTFK